jgi:glycerophosphoryl diester phosphodiesterase
MKTSYFAKYKGNNGISIAIKSPPYFKGEEYSQLFPKWSFLKKYLNDKDEIAYTIEYYKQILNILDAEKVYNDLSDKVLLCWESSDRFCHRRLVAEWIERKLDIIVPEII